MWHWVTSQFAPERGSRQRFLPRLKAGYLMLETPKQAGDWQRYHVALAGSSLTDLALFYYDPTEPMGPQDLHLRPKGAIALQSAHVDVLEEVLMVITPDKTWFLCAETSREANDWAQFICDTIDQMTRDSLRLHGANASGGTIFGDVEEATINRSSSSTEENATLASRPLKRLGSALALATASMASFSSSSSLGSLVGGSTTAPPPSSSSSSSSSSGMARPTRTRRLSSHVSSQTVKEIQSRRPKARTDEFLEVFVRSTRDEVVFQAMRSALSWSSIRNIVWRVWLGLIPSELRFGEWLDHLRQQRAGYERNREQVRCVFAGIGFQSMAGPENSGHDEHKQEEIEYLDHVREFLESCERSDDVLLHGIYQDVHRTQGTMEFFRDLRVQVVLLRVLYVYSITHTEISYNQGMGELLAVLAYLLHVEQFQSHASNVSPREGSDYDDESSYVYVESFVDVSCDNDDTSSTSYMDREEMMHLRAFAGVGDDRINDYCRDAVEEMLQEIADPAYLEHDCYLLLTAMMERMAGMYCPPSTSMGWMHCDRVTVEPDGSSPTTADTPTTPSTTTVVITQREEDASSPLYDQVRRIQDHILTQYDPPTAQQLACLGVEPEMLLLRWIRVLMAREFEMVEVWQLWDAIFALTASDFSFINVLCAAALKEFRQDILTCEDTTSVLLSVRGLALRIDAKRLVESARDIYEVLVVAATRDAEHDQDQSPQQ